ncbi:pyridoxamine 5'-phosphate oxidase-domain-containing protein [Scenedesmus sp. NREL 46B-D3]|nr:pyridoxamine 5'-phosphate oxidase-domain-containing protein [Scenedesmus sp. NREL 46B-D3]
MALLRGGRIRTTAISTQSSKPRATAVADFLRPAHTEHAKLARWLAHTAQWGTISAWDAKNQRPVGDGPPNNATGRPFFYMTPMDETTQLFTSYPRCSFTIAEAQLQPHGCGVTDPEDPTCAKITAVGRMRSLADADDADAAAEALFSRHTAMRQWPSDHGFAFFELEVEEVHMLDWYGGMHVIPAGEYYAADLLPPSSTGVKQQQQGQQMQQQEQQRLQRALRGTGSIITH